MRAGSLNRRLHLQRPAEASDAEGFVTENWADLDVVWAHINPMGAREVFQAGQPEERITHQVTIRWRRDVTTKMRFLYRDTPSATDRIFLIHSMLDQDEGHRQLDCLCEEIVTALMGAT